MLEVKDLCGSRGNFSLKNINLTVERAEYVVILGPTGAGKTILIEHLVGIHQPQRGSIVVDGKDITFLYPEERGIAYVPQDYALFPNLTAAENIAYGLKARREPKKLVEAKVQEMLTRLHIQELKDRLPLNLSGGERQRVALGRALAIQPKLVLLDEPLSALDESLRAAMARDLRQLQQEVGATFLHICHNFEEAADVADRIVLMNDGAIVQLGRFQDFLERPNDAFVARFFKAQNIFEGVSDGRTVNVGKTALVKQNKFPGPVTLVVRPEHIVVQPSEGKRETNTLIGTIVRILERPYFVELEVDVGMTFVVYAPHGMTQRGGERIGITIPPEKMLVLRKD